MSASDHIEDRLKQAGLRPTRQRLMLGSLLWKTECRHVTAEQLHSEAQRAKMQVSLATVYNTLHQFTEAKLLKEIVVDGGRSYFDTNMGAHHHFYHEADGMLEDIPGDSIRIPSLPKPPRGMKIESVDVVIRVRAN